MDRAVGVHADALGHPDEQYIVETAGVEQLNAAQFHQLGVAVTLSLPLQPDMYPAPPANLTDRTQTVAVKALALVHRHAFSPRRQPVRLAW
ncbi:hypothetical protein OG963_42090 [Streptomyces sp. NBC_01707]|uniref:hypothetical protein n=1 Tax=Streptomyces sp. NBC_01707 TaxID=2975914 RepID=UPI00352EA6C3